MVTILQPDVILERTSTYNINDEPIVGTGTFFVENGICSINQLVDCSGVVLR